MNDTDVPKSNSKQTLHDQKQAACLACRRSKVKCVRGKGEDICKKCLSSGAKCIIPEYHVGRYKGIKNKRSGLEKAIFQIEAAIKKAKTSKSADDEDDTRALQQLLDHGRLPEVEIISQTSPTLFEEDSQPHLVASASGESTSILQTTSEVDPPENNIAVNNADNPLQLLAIASAIPGQNSASNSLISPETKLLGHDFFTRATDDSLQDFFSPLRSKLDNLLELDPVRLGLVTSCESDMLFSYFHENLAHTRWGLDKQIHTASFVRSRSSFLFTSIIAASALFLPTTAALSKRLANHRGFLIEQILLKRFRSLEIVLAFMVNIPWMSPGTNWANDDETCDYLSTALTMAIDLSLNKAIFPPVSTWSPDLLGRVFRSECIDEKKALIIDGYSDVSPTTPVGRRLLRARERTWLALFNLDRGVCLARGRPWTVPAGFLVGHCDSWHITDIPSQHDSSLVASTVLRRDYGRLITEIRAICDQQSLTVVDSSATVKDIKEKIEGFFTDWIETWSSAVKQPDGHLPPYLEILVSHCKLSAYCGLVDHPTAASSVQQFFRAAGLTSAINVMRVAVQHETKLRSMPNNTVIMVSFAACFVLGLSTVRKGKRCRLDVNTQKSIEETADTLERIGSTPPHRNGASAPFGRHIRRIMNAHIDAYEQATTKNGLDSSPVTSTTPILPLYTLSSSVGNARDDRPVFDMMSDDQLLEAIQSASQDIDLFNANFQPDENMFMDWLDWPNLT